MLLKKDRRRDKREGKTRKNTEAAAGWSLGNDRQDNGN
jgi:hypothetical protein